ncbi:MAG: NAD(P)H-hydrate dehydratase [Pseudomonadota bacterium]
MPVNSRSLYSSLQVRQLEREYAANTSTSTYALMEKAGQSLWQHVQQQYPKASNIVVCCGRGNNAGDGFVLARLAANAKLSVQVIIINKNFEYTGDAQRAYTSIIDLITTEPERKTYAINNADVIVDALLGTGFRSPLEPEFIELIHQINTAKAPTIAVDLPSGLNADSGAVNEVAVKAHTTVTFIGIKPGLVTAKGLDYCGVLRLETLEVDTVHTIPFAHWLSYDDYKNRLKKRELDSNKGDYGHLLAIGGDQGMSGAIKLASLAALRTGPGWLSMLTHPAHSSFLAFDQPEIMVKAFDEQIHDSAQNLLASLLKKSTSILLGPGLGQNDWSRKIFKQTITSNKRMVLDADALNLLAQNPVKKNCWILTPHPGEAASLLGCSTREIQNQRFEAAQEIARRYGGIVVLKGAGSIVFSKKDQNPRKLVCRGGNPGMATGGMGDLLAGIIAGLLTTGYELLTAAELGVLLHARAGDMSAEKEGTIGMLASDLIPFIRVLMNHPSV